MDKYCYWCGNKRGTLRQVKNSRGIWAHPGGCLKSTEKSLSAPVKVRRPASLLYSSIYFIEPDRGKW